MRDLGSEALDQLAVPPGGSVEVIVVDGDGTVTNSDIYALGRKLDALTASTPTANSSLCVAKHVDSRHSPTSIWNYIHEDVEMEWIPELNCQAVDFLADGIPFAIESSTAAGDPDVCHTDCDL